MNRLVRRPLVRFLILGALLFVATRSMPAPRDARGADEDALVAEALRLGLDRRDPIVRRRLVANLRFAGADPRASDEELFREALALGMEKSDVVARRRLVQAMEQRLEAAESDASPDDRELRRFFAAHPERFTAPATWSFRHVLVSRERHPEGLDRATLELRSVLVAGGDGPEAAAKSGDPFLLGNRWGPASEAKIAAAFGDDFANAVVALEPGRWSEPVASAWGLHLVWVEEASAERRPTFEEARDRVRLAWRTDRREKARGLWQTAEARR